jgi:serine/threonine protein kinase
MPLQMGQILQDRYRIDVLLGGGGMGAVYRAYDTRLKQNVAIKENTLVTPESRKQFAREALVLAQVHHSNLPRVIDHFETLDGAQYLVMDFIAGEDLAQVVTRAGPLPEAQAIAWISQVCSALEYLHAQDPPVLGPDIKGFAARSVSRPSFGAKSNDQRRFADHPRFPTLHRPHFKWRPAARRALGQLGAD